MHFFRNLRLFSLQTNKTTPTPPQQTNIYAHNSQQTEERKERERERRRERELCNRFYNGIWVPDLRETLAFFFKILSHSSKNRFFLSLHFTSVAVPLLLVFFFTFVSDRALSSCSAKCQKLRCSLLQLCNISAVRCRWAPHFRFQQVSFETERGKREGA